VPRNARALLGAGAPLALGSDGPVGVATHLEMELMVEGGLTTAEVLTAATVGVLVSSESWINWVRSRLGSARMWWASELTPWRTYETPAMSLG
jgi:hypothetical protein